MPVVAIPEVNLAANNLCGRKLHAGSVALGSESCGLVSSEML